MYKILQQAGFKPDFVAGHSFGELTALWAAGVLSEKDYLFLVKARGQAMAAPKDPLLDAGAMLAVKGDVNQVTELIRISRKSLLLTGILQIRWCWQGRKLKLPMYRRL